jgi:IclR family transcriptional regulator, acetate operon repressor
LTAPAYERGSDVAVADGLVEEPRAVVETAFGLLTSLQGLGAARVSELRRHTGLPRTTVHRLLGQLEDVGAVERSGRRWRLGPALFRFGAGVPAQPRLRSVARRPLMDLANATGALVALSVEMAGKCVITDVMPGTRPLAYEPEPGLVVDNRGLAACVPDAAKLAAVRAHERAPRGDLRPVIDAGGADPRVSCVAVPLRIAPHDVAVVRLLVPGRGGVPAPVVEATRRTAKRIASELSPATVAPRP